MTTHSSRGEVGRLAGLSRVSVATGILTESVDVQWYYHNYVVNVNVHVRRHARIRIRLRIQRTHA